jgi:hypothetical protein
MKHCMSMGSTASDTSFENSILYTLDAYDGGMQAAGTLEQSPLPLLYRKIPVDSPFTS